MVPRVIKSKRKLHEQHVDPVLAIGFLVVFALLVGAYLIASFKYAAIPADMSSGTSAATTGSPISEKNKPEISPFASSDDFKSYLDDGLRSYGDGIFEAQTQQSAPDAGASEQSAVAGAKKAVSKGNIKNQKNTDNSIISPGDAKKFFSLEKTGDGREPDIIGTVGKNIFYSPDDQFYIPSPGTAGAGIDASGGQPDGETMDFSAVPAESLAQINSIPHDGNVLVSGNTLAILSNTNIFAYDVSDSSAPRDVWQARIGDGTSVIGATANGKELYLTLETKIDAANPCPIKPLVFGEKPFLIDCGSIYHPEKPILADLIFSVVRIDLATGKPSRDLSLVGSGRDLGSTGGG